MKQVTPKLDLLVEKSAQHALRSYCLRTDEGSNTDYRTPLGGKAPREEILSKWDAIYNETLNSYRSEEGCEFLNNYEQEMKSKVGPLSIQQPLSARIDSVESYYNDVSDTASYSKYDKFGRDAAVRCTIADFYQLNKRIRLRSISKTMDEMQMSTNSGLPAFSKRRLVKEKIRLLSELYGSKIKTGDGGSYVPEVVSGETPCAAILGGRGQEGGPAPEDVKQRAIGMFPAHVNVLELMFYQPVIGAIQNYDLIPAYVGQVSVEKRMTALFDTKDPDDLVIATDFSKMDQHFNPSMQELAGSIESTGFDNATHRDYGHNVFQIKYYIPILCDENLMYLGEHGMASGSGGTNLDESVAHRALQHYAAITNNSVLHPCSMMLGDDGIISFKGITVDKVVDAYTQFGMVMNPDKQFADCNATVYLRRLYHTKYRVDGRMVGIYSTYRALGKLMGQERFYDPDTGSKEMVVLRSLAILENVSNHPMFHKFVDFVIEGDKFKLGLAIPGFFEKLDAKYAQAKSKLHGFTSYTQELANEGINSGKVVKYLKSKL